MTNYAKNFLKSPWKVIADHTLRNLILEDMKIKMFKKFMLEYDKLKCENLIEPDQWNELKTYSVLIAGSQKIKERNTYK